MLRRSTALPVGGGPVNDEVKAAAVVGWDACCGRAGGPLLRHDLTFGSDSHPCFGASGRKACPRQTNARSPLRGTWRYSRGGRAPSRSMRMHVRSGLGSVRCDVHAPLPRGSARHLWPQTRGVTRSCSARMAGNASPKRPRRPSKLQAPWPRPSPVPPIRFCSVVQMASSSCPRAYATGAWCEHG